MSNLSHLKADALADILVARIRPVGRCGRVTANLASIAGNAIVIAVYVASRTAGLPFGPDLHHAESVGALDV